MISIIEEGDKLKEHVSSNILIKVYKNSTVPSLRFKSKHAHISLNDIKEKDARFCSTCNNNDVNRHWCKSIYKYDKF